MRNRRSGGLARGTRYRPLRNSAGASCTFVHRVPLHACRCGHPGYRLVRLGSGRGRGLATRSLVDQMQPASDLSFRLAGSAKLAMANHLHHKGCRYSLVPATFICRCGRPPTSPNRPAIEGVDQIDAGPATERMRSIGVGPVQRCRTSVPAPPCEAHRVKCSQCSICTNTVPLAAESSGTIKTPSAPERAR